MTEVSFTVAHSQVEMTELVLPNDTNRLGNLLGGQLMHWIDLAAAIAASRHTKRICVTASVDELNFIHPVKAGEVVILRASVNRVFRTSMEVGVKVLSENLLTGEVLHANSAYLTFVSIDENGAPVEAPRLRPESPEEVRRFEDALRRREQRLRRRSNVPKQ
ncbi:MAG TPA: acyl-CoA thioesterase [Bacteroidota bacterium]|nr:acyl-CoA thioesterase [Bacteroidota bacterium]